ncbi:hypothetical protein M3A49_26700 [Paraburkholderia sp. CNPSo 3076]|uniref:hypothetical protein n=1 Tax=Paraburkholderia sp. CNPSo 3076 TaxID=2940936 RepID=UPI00225A3CB5|nr:hypothetical protein [Paraburkholderia sp. CNPSo 3076]MCX5543035.1 hypothetical protein [Paraburkholderia sp. CNPSo 3076]
MNRQEVDQRLDHAFAKIAPRTPSTTKHAAREPAAPAPRSSPQVNAVLKDWLGATIAAGVLQSAAPATKRKSGKTRGSSAQPGEWLPPSVRRTWANRYRADEGEAQAERLPHRQSRPAVTVSKTRLASSPLSLVHLLSF